MSLSQSKYMYGLLSSTDGMPSHNNVNRKGSKRGTLTAAEKLLEGLLCERFQPHLSTLSRLRPFEMATGSPYVHDQNSPKDKVRAEKLGWREQSRELNGEL